jgi:asparagine synthase (glutamine-hydrolysing)
MCGIAGILALREDLEPPGLEQLGRMAGALRHRGPDEFGVYRDQRCGLAHARLAILDLRTGQQPMSNEDESLWVSFNGEIFNHLELRTQLESMGHHFRTQSDTEVIVHAYEAWGGDAFERFNGQWALALWDARNQRLVLSRDRVGVRPLYLCEHRGRLHFASEVKAIFAADLSIPRALDRVGLEETFTFWSIVPPQSVFAGVTELKPGHTRTYERGTVSEVPYWRAQFPIGERGAFKGTREDAAAAVMAALTTATKLRMRADVPVGSYLSGGLDSSLLSALGKEAKGKGFKTFSMRFEDAEFDETWFQHHMARKLATEHREVVITRADIARIFPEVIFHTERPVLRTAPAPLFLLAKLVRESGVKAVLSGEGADEVFAGYDLFREAKVRRFWARHPQSASRPRLLERLYPYLSRSPVHQHAITRQFFGRNLESPARPGFSHDLRWQGASALKRLFSGETRAATEGVDVVQRLLASLPSDFPRWTPLAQDQYLEIHTLLSGYLLSSQGDRMSMANSVELRLPFLDREVMRLAASVPPSFKLPALRGKDVLKRAAKGRVPPEIIGRKKQPYRAPDAIAFTGTEAPEWVDAVISESAIVEAGIFDPKHVRLLWNKVRARSGEGPLSNADNMAVVGVLSTQLLHAQLVRVPPTVHLPKLTTLHDALQIH